MIDKERIKDVFFDDVHGIAAKFRDENYNISEEEKQVIEDYVRAVTAEAGEAGNISKDDFICVIRIVEVLNMCADKFKDLINKIYYIISCE